MSETVISERTIEVVIDAFIVVAAVAVERFFTDYPIGEHDPAFQDADGKPNKRDYWYKLAYIISLVILVTLLLRFLIGSDAHLRNIYQDKPPVAERFLLDVCFLMLFGGFVVQAAIARHVASFMKWLAWCSGMGIVWSVKEFVCTSDHYLSHWWLVINSIQFIVTFASFLWLRKLYRRGGNGRTPVHWVLVVGALWFGIIFWYDLKHILLLPSKAH